MECCWRDGAFDPRIRAAMNCALPDMDLGTWTGSHAYPVYMGAAPDYSRSGESRDESNDWQKPAEDPEIIGCPGSWVHSPFAASVQRFARRRDDQGNRISKPALDNTDDWLIHDAVEIIEMYDESAVRDYLVQIRKRGSHGE